MVDSDIGSNLRVRNIIDSIADAGQERKDKEKRDSWTTFPDEISKLIYVYRYV